ncbi:6-phosphofructokinase 2 [Chitinophaga jiangningensis]|uniref:6-phosphofructokinase 2 n=1 Tax=Chitinophaga jiangningensis TaxID=1419482 RepID=A0A1M7C1G0_9BACT|nr:1-phosphofructokinase family hexose kinase [Chitinophaga jiangningensis]SHL61122.1 6-phosphofructokinase 2 [Chitinophaga jiangningensis]
MEPVITITLNPAIDKTTSVPSLEPDKKLKCTQPVFSAGGGGVNVARAICKLGGNAAALYFSGGHTGKFFGELLGAEKVPAIPILINGYTRENLIVTDEHTGQQYRFGMPGPEISATEWATCLSRIREIPLRNRFVVASGSLAVGVPPEAFDTIGQLVNERGGQYIVDTAGKGLYHAIQGGAFLFKPNLGELAALAGKNRITLEEAAAIAKLFIDAGNCQYMVISLGPAGAMLVSAAGVSRFNAPEVERVSTVGAGDSMVAGIVLKLAQGENIDSAVKFGVACGTAATLNPGTTLCHPEDVQKLYHLMD